MNDLLDKVAGAKDHVAPDWTPERERLVRAKIDVRASMRPKVRRRFAATMALAAMLMASVVFWRRAPVHTPQAAAPVEAYASLLSLEDGSSVVAKTPDARVEPIEVGPSVVSLRLLSGSARFSVTPNPKRQFSVLARDVTVTVLGTIFSVSLEPGGVRVTVERGRVHVAWPAGERVLRLGEEAFIPDTRAEPVAPVQESPADEPQTGSMAEEAAPQAVGPDAPAPGIQQPSLQRAPTPSSNVGPSSGSSGAVSWRTLAQDGDYAGAYARMQAERSGAVRDEPGDLLLAADVARLGGHPDKAISPLQRVTEKHAGDSRAPLAAFTLGHTLLDQLGRPREAAAAFAKARKLAPHGAMAQDALAREVESWSRAGEASLARERAEEYVAAYPKGRRLGAVRRLGGLD